MNKIDWISFSVAVDHLDEPNERTAYFSAQEALAELDPALFLWLFGTSDLEVGKGRAPYSSSVSTPDHGVTLYFSAKTPHALVEVSGKGCERLEANGDLRDLMIATANNLTRLDVACDMETGTRPLDFIAQRQAGRFKSHSEFVSESGETCYIGSRTSDRYTRVYRYNPPHERAHLLRAEFVVKGMNARITAVTILETGIDPVAAAFGEAFGFEHPDWTTRAATPVTLETWRPERREGKTLYWLADTIAPLLVRLHREGIIDVERWIRENVTDKL